MTSLLSLVGGGILPGLKFFRPTPAFFTHMAEYRGRTIYDVGCGMGHVTEALLKRGHGVLPIDVFFREGAVMLPEIADGTAYPYVTRSVVLLARPCHGWFVEPVIEQAVACGVHAVLYVSKARNAEGDLGQFRRRFRRILGSVGRDGETLYRFLVPERHYES